MSDSRTRVLYLHGLGGRRAGPRTERLKELGYEVLYPDLPADDYAKSVQIAADLAKQADLIVGSSRGGAVAMGLTTDKPLLLLAPAWKMFGVEPKLPSPTTIVIHGTEAERVPHTDSEELMVVNGAGGNLMLVTDTHSLNRPETVELIVQTAQGQVSGDLDNW
jgi:hypothetical protein